MICALTSIAFGMFSHGQMYKSCIYRCPREISQFYYHYPKRIRTLPELPCPRQAKVGG